jgi:hypothetical protein
MMQSLWNVLDAAILTGGSVMKRMLLLAGTICCASVISCLAADAPSKPTANWAVAYSGYNGVISNQVITDAECQKLRKQVDAEAVVFKKVLKLTEQDWKTSDATKNKSFPASAICKKKLDATGPFTDVGKAVDKVKSLDDNLKKKSDQAAKRKDEASKALKLSKDQEEKKKKKDTDEEAISNLARKLFENKMIKELGTSATGQDSTNAVPATVSSNAVPAPVQGTTTNAAK